MCPLIAPPHESLDGVGDAPIFSKENPSELIADIPLSVAFTTLYPSV